jgi:predicted metalloprotease
VPGTLVRRFTKLDACGKRDVREIIDRSAIIEQAKIRFLYERHAPRRTFFDLNQSCH